MKEKKRKLAVCERLEPRFVLAAAIPWEGRILAGSDDAEQRETGETVLNSPDLEMVADFGGNQTVGMRFTDVAIPAGASITNAYLQFQVDERTSVATSLTIRGEDTANAQTFAATAGNISSRATTTAAVGWSPARWTANGEAGADQQTPDLAAIIQEIVDGPGWSSGNALALIVTGTGERVAEAYEGDQAGAPLLHVEFSTMPSDLLPLAVDDSATTAENTPVTTSVLVNDDLGDAPTVITAVTQAAGGTVTFGAATTTYTPDANFTGLDSYTYTITDSDGDTSTATVTVDVVSASISMLDIRVGAGSDDAEQRETGETVLNSPDLEMVADFGGNQTVGMRFTDVAIPAGASITNAYLQFQVDERTSVATSLTIRGEDTANAQTFAATAGNISSRATTTAAVGWSPAPWTANGDAGSDQQTPDLAAIIQEIVNGPGWSSGNALALIVTGIGERVAEAYEGDQAGAPLLHVEFSTMPSDLLPLAVDDSATTAENTPVTTSVLVNDDLGDAPTVITAVTQAAGGTVTFGAATTTYTPDANFTGLDSYTYTITDSDGDTSTATVTVDVVGGSVSTLDIRVAAGSDDAEQRETGETVLNSPDLEMVADFGGNQTVGMRFTGVAIPAGASITNAYLQFQVDERTSVATSLTIRGEDTANAQTFAATAGNISSRATTTAAVGWSPAPWTANGEAGSDQQTPDLAAIIQEIVNGPGWSSGNALALIVTGTGERVAEAYEGDQAGAPLLHVEFSTSTSDLLPLAVDDSATTAENKPVTTSVLSNDDLGDAPTVITAVSQAGSGTVTFGATTTTYTPDANFTGLDSYTYTIADSDGDTSTATVVVDVVGSGVSTLDIRVAAGSDDAEETEIGTTVVTSTDLEMVTDLGVNQTVGIRFTNVTIPVGARIENAYVQFQSDEVSLEATSLTIRGEDVGNAATFAATSGNISSRATTIASTAWSPTAWTTIGEAGPDQRTPDLASIIQEIVDGAGWSSGNALALIVTGTGARVAESFNGDAGAAPLLHVEFSDTNFDPQAVDDTAITIQNVKVPTFVLKNDSPGNQLTTIAAVTQGASGTVSLDALAGTTTYTPNAGFVGADNYTYTITDASGQLSTATVSVTVNSVGATINVPGDQPTIQAGIDAASDGDLVLVAPGTYFEQVTIGGKSVILASRFYTTGDPAFIDQTVIDGGGGPEVISVLSDAGPQTKIIGLTIQNGIDGISPFAPLDILNNHFIGNGDAVDYEAGGGLLSGNLFESSGDDAIDLDNSIEVIIEDNTITSSGDDGMEIRLQAYSGPLLNIVIRNNTITGSGEDGIQIIDHLGNSDRILFIEHNLIENSALVGIGMMDNSDTVEDFRAASITDRIYLVNNTFVDNPYGVTGGDNVVALNNLFVNSTNIALKEVDGASIAAYNLFWNNGTDNLGSNVDLATSLFVDPLLDATGQLLPGSPAIDAGIAFFQWNGTLLLNLPPSAFVGAAPDMGAFEDGSASAAQEPAGFPASSSSSSESAAVDAAFADEFGLSTTLDANLA